MKLYLIKSEERDGLVKIGYTSGSVDARIGRYKTGISDNSVVYQTDGSMIFEKYLHWLASGHRKDIDIRLIERVYSPIEWFELPESKLKALAAAFDAKRPQSLDEIAESDLPAFLNGLLSAINWHATRVDAEAEVDEYDALETDRIAEAVKASIKENDLRINDLEEQLRTEQTINQQWQNQYTTLQRDYYVARNQNVRLSEQISEYNQHNEQLRNTQRQFQHMLSSIKDKYEGRIVVLGVVTTLLFFVTIGSIIYGISSRNALKTTILPTDAQPVSVEVLPTATIIPTSTFTPTPTPVGVHYRIAVDSTTNSTIQVSYATGGLTESISDTVSFLNPVSIPATVSQGDSPWIFAIAPDDFTGTMTCTIVIGRTEIEKTIDSGGGARVYCSAEAIE